MCLWQCSITPGSDQRRCAGKPIPDTDSGDRSPRPFPPITVSVRHRTPAEMRPFSTIADPVYALRGPEAGSIIKWGDWFSIKLYSVLSRHTSGSMPQSLTSAVTRMTIHRKQSEGQSGLYPDLFSFFFNFVVPIGILVAIPNECQLWLALPTFNYFIK